MRYLRQSTSTDLPIGPFLDDTDGKTPETALTITQPDIRLKKGGAAWAQKAAAQTLAHEEFGYYEVTLDATDTNTLGPMRLAVTETGALPVFEDFMVIPANIYDSWFSTDKQEVDVVQWLGTAPTTPTTAGVPKVDVSQLNGDSNGLLRLLSFANSMITGTADAGTSVGEILDTGRTEGDDYWIGSLIAFTSGNAIRQARVITDFVNATGAMTVDPPFSVNPGAANYVLIPAGATSHLTLAAVNSLLDSANGVETGWSLRQALRIISAVLAGEVSGAGSGTELFRDVTDTKTRVTSTVNASGDRTGVTYDKT